MPARPFVVRWMPPWPRLMSALCLALLLAGALPRPAVAQEPVAPPAAAASAPAPAVLALHHRRVVEFRAELLGDSPAERVALARAAIETVLAQRGPGQVQRVPAGETVRFEVDGQTVFFLTEGDVPGPRPAALLDTAAQQAEQRLGLALQEARELSDPRRLAISAARALGATLVALLLWRGLVLAHRSLRGGLHRRLEAWRQRHPGTSPAAAYAGHAHGALRATGTALYWASLLLLLDLWFTFVLNQFAYTRPWGERSTAWLLELLERFALGTVSAVPGLLTAGLIFLLARLATRALTLFMQRVERGELHVGWLDIDTAGPTRRLGNLLVWLFALAMAYPHLPGSASESFKGVTVLAGLMLSLGASGVVGQAMSGLSLMYSRALRVGEYVRIGDTEGTVTFIGLLATKVHTGMGEEVSLPNAVIVGQTVRNYSRLVEGGQFVLNTTVTIGYGTPWRQVHAMLLEAARRTPGVSADPAPYVMQTALSDFYVEYRLCAQADRSAPRRRAEAMNQLHANVQDVFNENGVQIMSPHYRSDPPQPQVVPPEQWSPALARSQQPPPAGPR